MYLKSFNFVVEHVAGKENQLADALSRDPGNEIFSYDDEALEALMPPVRTVPQRKIICASMIAQDLLERITHAQQEEFVDVKDAERRKPSQEQLQYSDGAFYVNENGHATRIYVPFSCRETVISHFHDHPLAYHPGVDGTLRAVRENYFWPRMREDIRRAVRNCAAYLSIKTGKPISKGNERSRQPIAPWDTVAIDLMGPYPRTSRGKRFVLVATVDFRSFQFRNQNNRANTRTTSVYALGISASHFK